MFDQLRAAVIEAVPLPCVYLLAAAGKPDFDPEKVQVLYTPGSGIDEELGRAAGASSCGRSAGWYYDDARTPKEITLCPAACEKVAAGGTVDIAFGCPPRVVL